MKRNLVFAAVILILGLTLGAKAQSIGGIWRGSAIVFPIDPAVTLATCATQQPPLVGVTYFCQTGMGAAISCNGTPYVNGVNCSPASVAGVSSITVNGGQKQTGDILLTIPSKATSTATVPAATFSQNGALTLAAPTVTTTIQ